ncbi:MAG: hypothetical protein GWP06_00850 [Actinobacteria bacterium]|nr:hypothetical protein [Actinomycetota bacterium]
MKIIEYVTKMQADGDIVIPRRVIKELNLTTKEKLLISIKPEIKKKGLAWFCGKWKDNRDVEDIISDVYKSRRNNNRAEKISL